MIEAVQDTDLAKILWDERCVRRVITKLARAQDDRDFSSYRSCFADSILTEQPQVTYRSCSPSAAPDEMIEAKGSKAASISADDWTATVKPIFARFSATHHRLSNFFVEIAGDDARCEVDISALHQVDRTEHVASAVIGGRYYLRLHREPHAWLITERRLDVRYTTGDRSILKLLTS